MKLFLILSLVFVTGCSSLQKKKPVVPPSVSTSQVIESLNETKTELEEAGESNTKVAANIEKALTLAERLDALLNQIEKEQVKLNNKNVITPEK